MPTEERAAQGFVTSSLHIAFATCRTRFARSRSYSSLTIGGVPGLILPKVPKDALQASQDKLGGVQKLESGLKYLCFKLSCPHLSSRTDFFFGTCSLPVNIFDATVRLPRRCAPRPGRLQLCRSAVHTASSSQGHGQRFGAGGHYRVSIRAPYGYHTLA